MAKRPRQRLARRGPRREAYDRVLIVCEGERTEPLYFRGLMARYRLSTANIEVVGRGSDPRTLVRTAMKLRGKEARRGERYDRVYCVFGRDEHATFDAACEEAGSSGIRLTRSWPCFEFWLRLHFGFSRRPYTRSRGKSAGQICLDELRELMPGYAKAAGDIFDLLEDRLESVIGHAARALTDAKATGELNPSTEAHLLVRYLTSLKPDEQGIGRMIEVETDAPVAGAGGASKPEG